MPPLREMLPGRIFRVFRRSSDSEGDGVKPVGVLLYPPINTVRVDVVIPQSPVRIALVNCGRNTLPVRRIARRHQEVC